MSFRKTFCLLAGLILAFGATDAFAQAATPQGVRVRMVSPDSAGYAGIGKTIKVNVLRTKSLAPALDTVIVALRSDTLSPRGISSLTSASFSADSVGLLGTASGAYRFVDTLTSANGSGTSVDTFKFTFTVTVGDPENNFVLAQSFVSLADNTANAIYKLNNFNLTAQSAVTGFTDRVGGRRFAKVDGQRPVNGSIFDSVLVDTAAATANFPGTTNRAFKIGDEVKLKMNVQNFTAASAKVGVYNINQLHADSALYSKSFDAATIVQAAGNVRDSFTVAAGQFFNHDTGASAPTKDNMRTRVVAYLVDNAGNLGADAATSASAQGFSQAITYVFDSNAPSITIAHPDSATDRFTGQVDTSIVYRKDDGTTPSTTFALKPLKFKVSNEGTLQRWAIVDKDTAEYSGTSSVADIEYVTADSFGASKGDKAGATVDLKIVVKDSVGNMSTKSVADVVHDQEAPEISNLFPASASLPEDKINNVTRHPIFRISEVADTISVRFVQAGVSPPDVATQSVSASKLTVVGEDISVTVNDSLIDDEQYSLQVFIKDLAGNVNFTALDTLTFDKNFQNPTADSFVVAVTQDSVIAGQVDTITVTAIDSQLTRAAGSTRKAVTYNKTGVLIRLDAGSQDLSTVKFWGTGVTDNSNGTANLDSENWVVGERKLYMKSDKVLDAVNIVAEDTSTTVVDGEATKVVNFNGIKKDVTVDEADIRKFMVTASDGEATKMQGAFQVTVVAADSWGNPTMKAFKGAADLTAGASGTEDSLALLDTRLASSNKKNLLSEIFVDFAANMGDAGVPSGPQSVVAGGSTFTVVAPNRTGEGLVISVRPSNIEGDENMIANNHLIAQGSVTVAFAAAGEVVVEGAPAAPANLVVQDYLGADGAGDQGHYVMVSFPNSADHANVAQYRLYRELDVTTGVDADGNAVVLDDAVKKWVAWTAVDAVPAGDEAITRAVVPVTDNMATKWAVAAEAGGASSEQIVAGKRVFTKESVQAMAQFLGVDANRVVSPEELGDMFVPSADYVKALLGDQKNVVFAALDPDVSSLLGASTVPTSIRTAGGGILSSAKTMTEAAVAAKDNLAPAQVTDVKVDGNAITWTASVDDRTVGYVNYRGFAIPIAGVTSYKVMGGASEDALTTTVGTVAAGVSSFSADELPAWIRVDALDLDNTTIGVAVQITAPVVWKTLADGTVLYLQVVGSTPNKVDFEDFIAFAAAFDAKKGDENFSINADTDGNGEVNFADFIAFAGSYDLEAPGPASKPVIGAPGVNENAEFSLGLGSDRVLVGETVSVDVSLANVQALMGYGFVLNYETDKFEFVEASAAEMDLLKSTGGETPLFRAWTEPGKVSVANAVINGSAVSGGGDVVTLTFRVLREFEENARFEIADGLVFDPKTLSNQAVVAGVLEFQSTPTEFALLQNFPNPFNPETTIQYNLAESADVTLQIYNVVGQVVRTLVAEQQPAGRYRVQWSGSDDRGVPVSSGIYFYKISAGKYQSTKKLMLLK